MNRLAAALLSASALFASGSYSPPRPNPPKPGAPKSATPVKDQKTPVPVKPATSASRASFEVGS